MVYENKQQYYFDYLLTQYIVILMLIKLKVIEYPQVTRQSMKVVEGSSIYVPTVLLEEG